MKKRFLARMNEPLKNPGEQPIIPVDLPTETDDERRAICNAIIHAVRLMGTNVTSIEWQSIDGKSWGISRG